MQKKSWLDKKQIHYYLFDYRTLSGKILDLVIIFLNIVICSIFVLETYPLSLEFKQIIWYVEVITIFFFLIEYIIRLYTAENPLKYFFQFLSLIDLIAISPTLLMLFFPESALSSNIRILYLIRALKVFRVFRFLRTFTNRDFFFGSISIHLLKVIRLISTIIMIFFVSSGLFFYLEYQDNPGIKNFGDAFYYSVVTLTTVGFGDITPKTDGGKWATILMIISGIMLIPWQASQVIKEWIYISSKTNVICTQCGLKYHDRDASHCKSCGNLIYQEYEGD